MKLISNNSLATSNTEKSLSTCNKENYTDYSTRVLPSIHARSDQSMIGNPIDQSISIDDN